MLVAIAAAIAVLISFFGNVSTYETFTSAQQKPGRGVKVVATLVPESIQYDQIKNPNYLTFLAKDTLNNVVKVVYHDAEPTDMRKSIRLVLDGKMQGENFECKSILLKCPSKYKNEEAAVNKLKS